MRRTVALAVFAALGLVLALVVEPPRRLTGRERARGPRAVRMSAAAVRRVELRTENVRLAAERSGSAWLVDGSAASPMLADALDALVSDLTMLRAVDAFRAPDATAFGLDPPAATIVLGRDGDAERLDLGSLNTVGSTVYARRHGHGRVFQLGVYVVELVRRVLAAHAAAAA